MNTNTTRIKNSQGQWATVWPISYYYYSLQYDGEKETVTITKGQLEVLKKYSLEVVITDHSVIKTSRYGEKYVASEESDLNGDFTRQCIDKLNMYTGCMSYNDSYFGEPEGELKRIIRQLDKTYKTPENKYIGTFMSPETFADKFEDILCRQSEDALYTSSPSAGGYSRDPDYSIGEDADKLIAEYTKAVEYKKGDKIDASILEFKIELVGMNEAQKAVEELAEASNTLLESIKNFTSGTGHDVFISEGVYKVYRSQEDMPYICYSDEQVVAVMDALKTLDEAGKEGEGRFFTLNIEGIV